MSADPDPDIIIGRLRAARRPLFAELGRHGRAVAGVLSLVARGRSVEDATDSVRVDGRAVCLGDVLVAVGTFPDRPPAQRTFSAIPRRSLEVRSATPAAPRKATRLRRWLYVIAGVVVVLAVVVVAVPESDEGEVAEDVVAFREALQGEGETNPCALMTPAGRTTLIGPFPVGRRRRPTRSAPPRHATAASTTTSANARYPPTPRQPWWSKATRPRPPKSSMAGWASSRCSWCARGRGG